MGLCQCVHSGIGHAMWDLLKTNSKNTDQEI